MEQERVEDVKKSVKILRLTTSPSLFTHFSGELTELGSVMRSLSLVGRAP